MKKLNILNGEALKEFFRKNYIANGEGIISFNDCLVDGEVHRKIFSEEFFTIRENFITRNYDVSPEVYKEKSISEIWPLLHRNYEEVALWFDFDMFCQINLLTILAYLDSIKFYGSVTVNIIKQVFFKCSSITEIIKDKIEIHSLDHFYDLYVETLIKKDFEKIQGDVYLDIFKQLPYLREGIKLYLNYKNPNNDIRNYINKIKGKGRQEILIDLINNLNHFGLGDVQYNKILDEMGIKT
ncbi:hypothetical protein [Bacillus sp. 1NLA3E]|uniref:hypothetical protein n=1 Tax=Bacillus sp. 1NLA3E TaxID=666686 RepID=UPI000247F0D5|nr:hypothetical protein [Bacillus sp. 1NLA3E]AGK53639.1 AraC family transcriptional regulator [Bacillus sp. 1NLA3E]